MYIGIFQVAFDNNSCHPRSDLSSPHGLWSWLPQQHGLWSWLPQIATPFMADPCSVHRSSVNGLLGELDVADAVAEPLAEARADLHTVLGAGLAMPGHHRRSNEKNNI